MKNRLMMLLMSAVLVTGSIGFIPTYAVNSDEAVEDEGLINEENEGNNLIEDMELTEDEEEQPESTELEESELSYDPSEVITTTTHDEVNTVQLSLHCKMPEYFTLGVRMRVFNNNTGDTYEIVATNANNYYGKLYVPAGEYTIASVIVDEDITNEYPMEYPDDFVVEDDTNHSMETTLTNFDEIQKEAYARMGLDENGNEIVEVAEVVEEPTEEEEITTASNILPWRVVNHTGEGSGEVKITGTSNGAYDVIVEITASGKGKEAEFHYSTDGGEHWSDVAVVNTAVEMETADSESIGLSLNFNMYDDYTAGDQYTFTSTYEYKAKSENAVNGNGEVRFVSDGVVIGDKFEISAEITKTGGIGTAEFRYTINGDQSENILIPLQGPEGYSIYTISDTNISIHFYVADDGKFVVGDAWSCEFKGEKEEKDYTIYMIAGAVLVIAIIFMVYAFFNGKKDKLSDYRMMTYKKMVVDNEPSKKKNKRKDKGKSKDQTEDQADDQENSEVE